MKGAKHSVLMREIEDYHKVIHRPLTRVKLNELPVLFGEAIDHVKVLAPEFPKDAFMDWYAKHPYRKQELFLERLRGKKLGDFLHAKVTEFEKTIPHFDLEKVRHELSQYIVEVGKKCGSDEGCQKVTLGPWIRNKFKNTCLGNPENKAILESVISGIAIYNVSLVAGHFSEKNANASNFPVELFLDRAIMYPIFSEIGCRNTIRKTKEDEAFGTTLVKNEKDFEIGNEVETRTARTRIRHWTSDFGRSYVSYMKWSPIEEGFYLGLHIVVEKVKGHEVNTEPASIGKEFLGLVAYDAGWAYLIRSPLISDPLFLKWMPRYKQVVKNQFPGKMAWQLGLYHVPEVSLRLLQ